MGFDLFLLLALKVDEKNLAKDFARPQLFSFENWML
jgi:hypothetical protein